MSAAVSKPITPRVGLAAVKRGKLDAPIRLLAYGPEGIGKSTLAAGAPGPLFIGAEDGTEQLDVARVEPKAWDDVFFLVSELATTAHDYRTVVLDTADWAEPLCWEHVCKQGGKKSIEEFGYGKGYVAALDEWRRLLSWLDRLRSGRGMNAVLLAHARVAQFKNPEGDDYDRYTLKLHEKASGLLKEWCDAVLFCQYETFTHDKGGRTKGIDSGARVMHTVRRAAFDAKNRYGLPEKMPLSWEEFAAGVQAHAPKSPDVLRAEISALLGRMSAADKTRAEAATKRAGEDPIKLSQLADWARGKVNIQEEQST